MREITNQIVNELVDPTKNLSDILRKVSILAVRLKQEDLKDLVRKEQDGYQSNDLIPDYRKDKVFAVKVHLIDQFGRQIKNASIPITRLPIPLLQYVKSNSIRQGVKSLETLISSPNKNGVLMMPWPKELPQSKP